jgi:enoyl-CoA hydratase/carnithine racemase
VKSFVTSIVMAMLTDANFMFSWRASQDAGDVDESERLVTMVHGFANISRRNTSSKPLIAAVNGGAYGGGVEIILNCDLVIASDTAVFALPEVKRGVIAAQGGLY